MKAAHAVLALAVLAAALIWWPERRSPQSTGTNPALETDSGDRGTSSLGTHGTSGDITPPTARPEDAERYGSEPAVRSRVPPTADTSNRPQPDSAWPIRPGDRGAHPDATTAGTPAVPTRLAFRALWYLGADPEAEKTWTRAINDPRLPDGVRSDLIVDMIDEGYTDNNHPGEADLPVILARLEIIERLAPYAMDDVNARAFEEAYRHLLDLYVRLGGKPRAPR